MDGQSNKLFYDKTFYYSRNRMKVGEMITVIFNTKTPVNVAIFSGLRDL